MATYDEFNSGIILPSLVQNLKDILERYPDDNQIIKVCAHLNVHRASYLGKFTWTWLHVVMQSRWLFNNPCSQRQNDVDIGVHIRRFSCLPVNHVSFTLSLSCFNCDACMHAWRLGADTERGRRRCAGLKVPLRQDAVWHRSEQIIPPWDGNLSGLMWQGKTK